jgi:predicted nucleic acid-binding Zn ribbon protein
MKAKAARKPQRIGSILEKTLKKMSLDTKLKEYEVWNVWDDAVGEYVSRNAQPDFMRNKILYVRVSSSPWMQQLSYMGKGITEALNERLGAPIVEEIRFKLGKVDLPSEASAASSRPANPSSSPENNIAREIRENLSPIKDSKLREILGKLILKDREVREGKIR